MCTQHSIKTQDLKFKTLQYGLYFNKNKENQNLKHAQHQLCYLHFDTLSEEVAKLVLL